MRERSLTMPKLNVIETINNVEVKPGYALTLGHMNTIRDYSGGTFKMAVNFFKFGYAQGVKAERAAQKRK